MAGRGCETIRGWKKRKARHTNFNFDGSVNMNEIYQFDDKKSQGYIFLYLNNGITSDVTVNTKDLKG